MFLANTFNLSLAFSRRKWTDFNFIRSGVDPAKRDYGGKVFNDACKLLTRRKVW